MSAYTNQDAHKDVTAEFKRYKSEGTSVDDRITATNGIIDKYLLANDKVPPQSVLERLGTLLLSEDSTNNLSNKTRTDEYPVLSDNQYRRRTEGRHKARKSRDGKFRLHSQQITELTVVTIHILHDAILT